MADTDDDDTDVMVHTDDVFSKALECSIHLGMIKQPKALPCLHTFCRDCLVSLISGSQIKCPLCREICQLSSQGVDGLPCNVALQNVVDALCSCQKAPKMETCPFCEQHVCTTCLNKHHSELPIEMTGKKLRLNNMLRFLGKTSNMLAQSKSGFLSDVKAVGTEVTTSFQVAYEHLRGRETQLKDKLNTFAEAETRRIDQCQKQINAYQRDIKAALKGIDTANPKLLASLEGLYRSISAKILSMVITAPIVNYKVDALLVHDIFKELGLIDIMPPKAEQGITLPEKHLGIDYNLVGMPKKVFDLGYRVTGYVPRHLALSPVSGNLVVVSTAIVSGKGQVDIFTADGKFLLKFVPKGYQIKGFSVGFPVGIGGLAVTHGGEIVLTDTSYHRLQVFDEAGWFVRKIGSRGYSRGQFINPAGVSCDSSGHLYVCDQGRVQVINKNGSVTRVITEIGGGRNLRWMPGAIAVCPDGDLVVVNKRQTDIHVFSETDQHWSTIPCGRHWDVKFGYSACLAMDSQGNILVSDVHGSHKVFVVEKSGNLVCSFGGEGESPGKFCSPCAIVVTPIGDIIVLDNKERVQIF